MEKKIENNNNLTNINNKSQQSVSNLNKGDIVLLYKDQNIDIIKINSTTDKYFEYSILDVEVKKLNVQNKVNYSFEIANKSLDSLYSAFQNQTSTPNKINYKDKNYIISKFDSSQFIDLTTITNLSNTVSLDYYNMIYNISGVLPKYANYTILRAGKLFIGFDIQKITPSSTNINNPFYKNELSKNFSKSTLDYFINNPNNVLQLSNELISETSRYNQENSFNENNSTIMISGLSHSGKSTLFKKISTNLILSSSSKVSSQNSSQTIYNISFDYKSMIDLIYKGISTLNLFGCLIINLKSQSKNSYYLSSRFMRVLKFLYCNYNSSNLKYNFSTILYQIKLKVFIFETSRILKNESFLIVHGFLEVIYKFFYLAEKSSSNSGLDDSSINPSVLKNLEEIYNLIKEDFYEEFYQDYNMIESSLEEKKVERRESNNSLNLEDDNEEEIKDTNNKSKIENDNNDSIYLVSKYNSQFLIQEFSNNINDFASLFNNPQEITNLIFKNILICLYLKKLVFINNEDNKSCLIPNNNYKEFNTLITEIQIKSEDNFILFKNNYKYLNKLSLIINVEAEILVKNLISKEIRSPNGSFYINKFEVKEAEFNLKNLVKLIYEELTNTYIKCINLAFNNRLNEINLVNFNINSNSSKEQNDLEINQISKEITKIQANLLEKLLKNHTALINNNINNDKKDKLSEISVYYKQVVEAFGYSSSDDSAANSLESLFVNYSNDKLNSLLFEQQINKESLLYKSEGLSLDSEMKNLLYETLNINNGTGYYSSIKACEDKTNGIFKLLDVQSAFIGKGSLKTLVNNISKHWGTIVKTNTGDSKRFSMFDKGNDQSNLNNNPSFTLTHYGQTVEYGDNDLILKNAETVIDDWKSIVFTNLLMPIIDKTLLCFKFSSKIKALIKGEYSNLGSIIMKKDKFVEYFVIKEFKDFYLNYQAQKLKDKNIINPSNTTGLQKGRMSVTQNIKLKSNCEKFIKQFSKLYSSICSSELQIVKMLTTDLPSSNDILETKQETDSISLKQKIHLCNQLSTSGMFESIQLAKNGFFLRSSTISILKIIAKVYNFILFSIKNNYNNNNNERISAMNCLICDPEKGAEILSSNNDPQISICLIDVLSKILAVDSKDIYIGKTKIFIHNRSLMYNMTLKNYTSLSQLIWTKYLKYNLLKFYHNYNCSKYFFSQYNAIKNKVKIKTFANVNEVLIRKQKLKQSFHKILNFAIMKQKYINLIQSTYCRYIKAKKQKAKNTIVNYFLNYLKKKARSNQIKASINMFNIIIGGCKINKDNKLGINSLLLSNKKHFFNSLTQKLSFIKILNSAENAVKRLLANIKKNLLQKLMLYMKINSISYINSTQKIQKNIKNYLLNKKATLKLKQITHDYNKLLQNNDKKVLVNELGSFSRVNIIYQRNKIKKLNSASLIITNLLKKYFRFANSDKSKSLSMIKFDLIDKLIQLKIKKSTFLDLKYFDISKKLKSNFKALLLKYKILALGNFRQIYFQSIKDEIKNYSNLNRQIILIQKYYKQRILLNKLSNLYYLNQYYVLANKLNTFESMKIITELTYYKRILIESNIKVETAEVKYNKRLSEKEINIENISNNDLISNSSHSKSLNKEVNKVIIAPKKIATGKPATNTSNLQNSKIKSKYNTSMLENELEEMTKNINTYNKKMDSLNDHVGEKSFAQLNREKRKKDSIIKHAVIPKQNLKTNTGNNVKDHDCEEHGHIGKICLHKLSKNKK